MPARASCITHGRSSPCHKRGMKKVGFTPGGRNGYLTETQQLKNHLLQRIGQIYGLSGKWTGAVRPGLRRFREVVHPCSPKTTQEAYGRGHAQGR